MPPLTPMCGRPLLSYLMSGGVNLPLTSIASVIWVFGCYLIFESADFFGCLDPGFFSGVDFSCILQEESLELGSSLKHFGNRLTRECVSRLHTHVPC